MAHALPKVPQNTPNSRAGIRGPCMNPIADPDDLLNLDDQPVATPK